MRNTVVIITIILTSFLSCSKTDDENCHPESFWCRWTSGKEIVTSYNTEIQRYEYHIADGDQIVFDYVHVGPRCDDMYDEEWSEDLTFSVPENITSFELRDDELLNAKCHYGLFGAWVSYNQYQVKDGIISGRKVTPDHWEISASVYTTPLTENEQPKKIEFTRIFKK